MGGCGGALTAVALLLLLFLRSGWDQTDFKPFYLASHIEYVLKLNSNCSGDSSDIKRDVLTIHVALFASGKLNNNIRRRLSNDTATAMTLQMYDASVNIR